MLYPEGPEGSTSDQNCERGHMGEGPGTVYVRSRLHDKVAKAESDINLDAGACNAYRCADTQFFEAL